MKKFTTALTTILFLFQFSGDVFAVEECPDNPRSWLPYKLEKKWNNCFGTYTFANGDKYVGEWNDGKPDGEGIRTSTDGRVKKEGVFIAGKFSNPQQVSPKIVTPRIEDNKIVAAASGTGFAVSNAGHIITNYHLVDACTSINITHAGKEIPATVLFFDAVNDLAILKSDMQSSSILAINRKNPQLMEDIFVAGYPFGRKLSTSIKVTKGIVSSLSGINNNYSRIQIDAALQPGNSGGPIFDNKGNVVGVAVAKLDLIKAIENFGALPENINFGIKSNVVLNFLESNNILGLPTPNTSRVSMTELGRTVTDATYYLSCMMTMAQVRKMQYRKVMYSDLIE